MLTQIVYDFEAVHQKGEVPSLQDFVPAESADRAGILVELVRIDLEYRRKRDLPIRVDNYLTPFPELDGDEDLLLEIIEAEYRSSSRRGEQPTTAIYAERYPALADRLLECLSGNTEDPYRTNPELMPVAAGADLPVLAGYEVLALLGEGGMGVVYRARHLALNRTVALKMIKGGALVGSEAVQRFHSEAQAVARLQHPNIVQIHEIGEQGGLPYFTLEYCAGGSLARKLDGTPLPAREAAGVVQTLAWAMEAAHEGHVLHRDLKPANILLSSSRDAESSERSAPVLHEYTLKITDFGLAKQLDAPAQHTQSGAIVGTPSYMAPEQARGDHEVVGPQADVYALGAILYELLTGRPPFKAATSLDTVLQVLHDEPVPVRRLQPKVPRDLETICLKCLEKEPRRRYASAAELAEDLRRFQAGEPVRARPVGAVETAWRWCRRQPALAGLWAAAVLLSCLSVAGALWYQGQRAEAVRKEGRTEGGVRLALQQCRDICEKLRADLTKPGGVQQQLDKSAEWQAAIATARSHLDRARLLAANQDKALEGELATSLQELDQELVRDEGDYCLAARLEQIRLNRATFDNSRAEQEYPEVFREAGLAIEPGQQKAVATLIQESAIKEQLLAALDDWAWLGHIGKHAELTSRLLETARLVDADPWRNRVRDPALWKNREALLKLAEEARANRENVTRLSPQMLVLIATLLPSADQEKWLREAHGLHPADFWINFQLAVALAVEKKHLEAVGFFRVALAVRPNSAWVYLGLGTTLQSQEDFPAAIDAFKKVLSINPDSLYPKQSLGNAESMNPEYVIAWRGIGNALRDQKKLPEAIDAYKKALTLAPRFSAGWNDLGNALRDHKDFPGARKAYQKALASDPKYAFAWNGLGNVLRDQKDLTAAAAAYRRAVAIDPKYAFAWNGLGNVLRDQKDLPAAVTAYERAVAIDPMYALGWSNLSLALCDLNDLSGAIAASKKALANDPSSVRAWKALGNALYSQKNLPAAIDAYKKAVAVAPEDAGAWNNLGVALMDQHDWPGAIAAYKKAVALDPAYTSAWNRLGNALRAQKDLPTAIKAYKKALAIDPKYVFAWNDLGASLADQRDLPGAVKAYKAAVAIDPAFALAWHNLGNALRDQKDLPAAIAAYEKALAIDPRRASTWNELGVTLYSEQNLPAAIDAYRKALAIDPKTAHVWYNLGKALGDQKDVAAAIAAYEKALAIDPKYAIAWSNLGNALRAQKELPAAIAACKKAIESDPNYPQPHVVMALALREQGRFADAVASMQRARGLLPKGHVIRPTVEGLLKECRQLRALDERLPHALNGEKCSPAEYLAVANLCQRYKKRYADATTFYVKAFAAEPAFASDMRKGARYNAACAAVMAAAGKGVGAEDLKEKDKSRFHRQARDWLGADLAAWRKLLEKTPQSAAQVQQVLQHWQEDADLTSVRDDKELARLPAPERDAWCRLWADVEALREHVLGGHLHKGGTKSGQSGKHR
jgi:tetratricopeptide (TPR) repeat protein